MSLKPLMVNVLICFGIFCKQDECVNYVQAVTEYAELE
nr:MAG TPA: hypothetical protein [Caudoviricetes sp.]